MGLNSDLSELMFPENPSMEEIPLIADLAQGMKEYFPGFVRSEFELLLKEKIEKNEAIIECSKCRSVFIMSSKDSHLYEGPLHAPITFAVHPIPSGAEFVRAICTDYDGNISWTQAIWL